MWSISLWSMLTAVALGIGVPPGIAPGGEEEDPPAVGADPTRPSAALREAFGPNARLASPGAGGLVRLAPSRDKGRDPLVEVVDFRKVQLVEALRMLSEQTGLNLVASSDARETPITLHLQDVRASSVLDVLAKTHGLWTRRDPKTGIVRVHTVQEYRRERSSLGEDRTEAGDR